MGFWRVVRAVTIASERWGFVGFDRPEAGDLTSDGCGGRDVPTAPTEETGEETANEGLQVHREEN